MSQQPANYKALANGAGNQLLHTGRIGVVGFTVDAAAAATVKLHDSLDVTGPIIGEIVLAGAGGDSRVLPNVQVQVGIFVERSAAAAVVVFVTPT